MSRSPVKSQCPRSPPLPATTADLQFPFELHKREIIGNFTDVMRGRRGQEQVTPLAPKLMTWLTLTAERETLLHPFPICLGLGAHQSNESSIQPAHLRELWRDRTARENRRIAALPTIFRDK